MRLWLIPTSYIVVSLVGGAVVPRIEASYLPSYSLSLSTASAQAYLSATASGMMALTGVVFAMAFVMVQFSAVAYSPRLVLWMSRDRTMFHSLGIFSATFTFSLSALAWIDREGSGRVPILSSLIVAAMLVASLILFSLLIQRVGSLQVTNVLFFIGDRGRATIREVLGSPDRRQEEHLVPDQVHRLGPTSQALVYGGDPRAIARLDITALTELARGVDGVIVMACAVGDTVMRDTVLLRVHGGSSAIDEERLLRAIVLRRTRTFEQDPAYPLRLLVDIAIRALSPAVNDPTTAVQTIDQLEDLLRRIEKVHIDLGVVKDRVGATRVLVPMPSWDDYLRLAFDEIRQYGAGSLQVMRRMRSALDNLLHLAADEGRAAAVRNYIVLLDQAIARSFPDASDQSSARQKDLQGLGVSQRFEDDVDTVQPAPATPDERAITAGVTS